MTRALRSTSPVLVLVAVASVVACSREAPEAGLDPVAPPPAPPECEITLAGPPWIVEGERLQLSVGCRNGAAPPADLVLEGLPAAARLDPLAGEIVWQTGLADAGVYRVSVRVPGKIGAQLQLGIADRWNATANTPPDPARYTEEYGLPVFHLQVDEAALSDVDYVPAMLTYRGTNYSLDVKYRGAISLNYPKKSLTLSFPGGAFSDPVLGFPPRKKILLVTTFDDQTLIRNRLALGLWSLVADHPIDVRTASAVLYLNGEFRGVYMMSEKIAGQVLEEHGLDGDGNLYFAMSWFANFRETGPEGQPKVTWHDGYEKDEGTPLEGEPGAFDDLDAFVQLVATADDATFAAALPETADVDELRDWWVLAMLTYSTDCVGKNTFLYHDPRGGPWRATVWDYSGSLGRNWQTFLRGPENSTEFTDKNHLFERLLAPPFDTGTRARLGTALRERVPVEAVIAEYDRLVAETAAAAWRDDARWGSEQRAFFENWGRTDWHSYEDEVAYAREWIAARWAYLAERY
ncbi:CotH kinase family protein [Anaeromyxobacter sp. SG17]|uniref:CotH kinase family protein n=1 Tax=Anaeromyxobacter sp. SG17 TaxID=2925405 RepID=UPI001F5A84AB|nr:CotH kinase family protein [Anaeromyxobacter sp. SG17]